MAKKNLSRLVKKIITNKRGHRTSVWVKTDKEQPKEKKTRLDTLEEDIRYKVKTYEKPSTQQLEDRKVIIEFQQKRNKQKKESLRQEYQNHINKLEDAYEKKYGYRVASKTDPKKKRTDEVKQISPKEKRTLKESLSDLSQKLYSKVKRRERGQGGEISLTTNEVKELLAKGRLGFISAGKNPADPRDMKLSDEDIEKRYGKLKDELVELGYVFIPVRGKYGEEEDSYMVMIPEAEKSDLNKLGKKYNQDSVIYAEKGHNELRYTTGENAGKHNDGDGFEQVQDAKDFFTEVKTKDGVLKFRLNIDFDKLLKAFGNFIQILRV